MIFIMTLVKSILKYLLKSNIIRHLNSRFIIIILHAFGGISFKIRKDTKYISKIIFAYEILSF